MAQAVQETLPRRPGDHRPFHRRRVLLRFRLRAETFTPEDLEKIEERMRRDRRQGCIPSRAVR
ncbi:MAG: hypothetical protein MZV70_67485 [Desulfobacterales bacterium]|nr:hypothetical protein [Desulfobacterales bacterium]